MINGSVVGIVLDNRDPSGLHRVKVRFPVDDGVDSSWCRIASPMAGADRGLVILPDIGTEVLAASIRHPMHLVQAALAGADVATVPFKVLKAALRHPLTDSGNERFLQDWSTVPERDIPTLVERFLAKRA